MTDLSPVWISLRTTAAASLITFFLGILAAWWVLRMKNCWLKMLLDGFLTVPLVLPPTVAGFFLLYLFGANRPLGRLFIRLFDWQIPFSWWATVIAAAAVSFPLMYRSAKAGFQQLEQGLVDEAKLMGLGDFRILWQILVPCSLPSVVSGFILALTRGLGEYGATAMLAGNIPGKTRTMPLAVYSQVAAGHMKEAWIYVAVILAIALWAVCLLGLFAEKEEGIRL